MSSFSFDSVDKKQLVISSLKSKRMLLSQNDFNSLADYLLFKRFIKRVEEVYENEQYVIARTSFTIPIRERNRTEKRVVARYIIVGEDENGKLVCFYSDHFVDNSSAFWFDEDLSRFEEAEIRKAGFQRRYRVQGDIVLVVSDVREATTEYLNTLFNASEFTIQNILRTELYRRISDILADLGISSTITETNAGNSIVIDGCPRNIKMDKLMNYIFKNLILSDVFKNYTVRLESGYERDWYLIFTSDENVFTIAFWIDVERRLGMQERELIIRAEFPRNASRELPEHILFMNMVQETNLLNNISEQESEERIGRHTIYIENAFPRQIVLDYEFPLTKRRYSVLLNSENYVTSGTKIKLSHPQHGNKVVKIPQSRFLFTHVNNLYRTTAVKNNLLLHYYFT
ncbi:MAG: hypothetical protein QXL96_11470 [Ignisphaera sp.]